MGCAFRQEEAHRDIKLVHQMGNWLKRLIQRQCKVIPVNWNHTTRARGFYDFVPIGFHVGFIAFAETADAKKYNIDMAPGQSSGCEAGACIDQQRLSIVLN